MIQLDAGDIIKMKKKHPCGSDEPRFTEYGWRKNALCT